jgi:DICT domain-containing protein
MLPDVAPIVLSRRSMLAVSHAIEFEAATRAESPWLIGAFQQERFWRPAAGRWRDLSVRSAVAVVLVTLPRRAHRGNLWEVPLPANAPLTREWAVVCDSPTFAACLVGVERPGRRGGRAASHFEALWTIEPRAVRATASAALRFAADVVPELGDVAASRRELGVDTSPADVARNATALTNRLLTTFDALVHRRV